MLAIAGYDIHDNFFFMADGWKMDFGGHDSKFRDNVVYHAHNDGQNCFNTWPFLPGAVTPATPSHLDEHWKMGIG